MSKANLIRVLPRNEVVDQERQGVVDPRRWIGRIAIFELSTGTRVQGKILALSEDWIDTDNGAVRIDNIVHAKWVSPEEASIIRTNVPLLGGRGW